MINPDNRCWFNSTMQAVAHSGFGKRIVNMYKTFRDVFSENQQCIIKVLEYLMNGNRSKVHNNLINSALKAIEKECKDFGYIFGGREHKDASDFLVSVLEPIGDIVESRSNICTVYSCRDCSYSETISEPITNQISVSLKVQITTIDEILTDFKNSYAEAREWPGCRKRCVQSTTLDPPPSTLIINLKR